jgi:hypothetical protein
MDVENEIIESIIETFCGRHGFDDWWYNIDTSVQEEIKEELKDIIKIKQD